MKSCIFSLDFSAQVQPRLECWCLPTPLQRPRPTRSSPDRPVWRSMRACRMSASRLCSMVESTWTERLTARFNPYPLPCLRPVHEARACVAISVAWNLRSPPRTRTNLQRPHLARRCPGWGWPLPVTLKPQAGHSRLQPNVRRSLGTIRCGPSPLFPGGFGGG